MKKINTKRKTLEEVSSLIDKHNTIMVVSIKGIPSVELQKIKREIKKLGVLKIAKKTILERALKKSKKERIENLAEDIQDSCALLFSDKDPFEIAAFLSKKKIPAKAKAGQEAPEDIVLKSGPTDLPPGPLLSEIAKLGVKTGIEGGKIVIKETKVLVKKGETIPEEVASVLSLMEITPFSLTPKPIAAYSAKESKIYKNIEIDIEKTAHQLKEEFSKAILFAIAINYIAKETIKPLIIKARNEALVLSKNLKNQVE